MTNDSCGRPCPNSRGICRREFLKIAAAMGVLVACNPRQQSVPPPANTSIPTTVPTGENPTSKVLCPSSSSRLC